MRQQLLIILSTLVFTEVNTRTTNLKIGTSCAFSFNCESGCCEMGFDPTDETGTTLGFYCFASNFCTPGALKHPGQSCRTGTECQSTCCEDTVCQAYATCFNQYILPFVIVFGILATFLVTAVVIVMVHKCRKA